LGKTLVFGIFLS